MLKRISNIEFLAPEQLEPLPDPDPDLSQFEGREEWYIIVQHRHRLIQLGVNLAAIEVVSAVEGRPANVEGGVLAFLSRHKEPSISATRKLSMLIFRGAAPANHANMPYLPIRTAAYLDSTLVAPTPAPRRSIPELQADLDADGARAITLPSYAPPQSAVGVRD